MSHYCARCNLRPCRCVFERRPGFEALEDERPEFERYIRREYPERSLQRYGDTYQDDKVRNRWIGWQAKARAMA